MSFSPEDAAAVYKLSQSDTHLGRKVLSALRIIEEALDRYGPALALSFNGGKDCTVLVHLFAAALCQRPSSNSKGTTNQSQASTSKQPVLSSDADPHSPQNGSSSSHTPLPCIYVQCQSPFPQVETFVDECQSRYNLDLVRINAGMKDALGQYKIQREAQGQVVEAVLVGTRVGDPYSDKLLPFVVTDPGWPHLMRVHPILDWTYDDIWNFLRCPDLGEGGIGWCSLYNYGYTSLGSTFNTIPNPLLRDTTRSSGWKAAWELEDHTAERAGRPAGPLAKEVSQTLSNGSTKQANGV